VFRARLDGALSNLVTSSQGHQPRDIFLMAGGLELDDLQGPFQPLPFYDSITLFASKYGPHSHLGTTVQGK